MMQKKIKLQNKEIKYNLKKSKRARQMRLTIYCDGSLVATVPQKYSASVLEQFILEKSNWIMRKIEYFNNFGNKEFWKNSPEDYLKCREEALEYVENKLGHFNHFYNFKYGNIFIRNQKTRWGSCSRNGNLSFNYKIIFLPEALADYIIVHEICHLKEFNHSSRFWHLVGETIADYKRLRREVRKL